MTTLAKIPPRSLLPLIHAAASTVAMTARLTPVKVAESHRGFAPFLTGSFQTCAWMSFTAFAPVHPDQSRSHPPTTRSQRVDAPDARVMSPIALTIAAGSPPAANASVLVS